MIYQIQRPFYAVNRRETNMARVFITGSSDGLGSLVAQALVKKKHQVVLHARNAVPFCALVC